MIVFCDGPAGFGHRRCLFLELKKLKPMGYFAKNAEAVNSAVTTAIHENTKMPPRRWCVIQVQLATTCHTDPVIISATLNPIIKSRWLNPSVASFVICDPNLALISTVTLLEGITQLVWTTIGQISTMSPGIETMRPRKSLRNCFSASPRYAR